MINPYLLDAFGGRERCKEFAQPRFYVPILQGDGRTILLRARFNRKSEAEKWAIRVRSRLMRVYDAKEVESS